MLGESVTCTPPPSAAVGGACWLLRVSLRHGSLKTIIRGSLA